MQKYASFIIFGYRRNGQTTACSHHRCGKELTPFSFVRRENAPLPTALTTPKPSLWSNDPTHGMTPRQHNPAMVDFCWRRAFRLGNFQSRPLYHRPATSRAGLSPVFIGKHGMTLAANAFHIVTIQERTGASSRIL
jgi:hypothetical protein